jgi:hypothetical protein
MVVVYGCPISFKLNPTLESSRDSDENSALRAAMSGLKYRLTLAKTFFNALETAVLKATKHNMKSPKEKHLQSR